MSRKRRRPRPKQTTTVDTAASTHGGSTDPDTPWAGDGATAGSGEFLDEAGGMGPDRYELFEEVGRGGIGIVFRGRDRILGRTLAVKVLAESYRDRPDARRRFLTEARVGSQFVEKAPRQAFAP